VGSASDRDGLADGDPARNEGPLGHEGTEERELPPAQVADVPPAPAHRSGDQRLQARERADERRLAGAIGPDDRDQLAGRDRDGGVVDDPAACDLDRHLAGLEERRAHTVLRRR
jgi:hypothetical protein